MKALVPFAGAGIRSRPSSHAPAEQPVSVAQQPVSPHGPEAIANGSVCGPETALVDEFPRSRPCAQVMGPEEQPEPPTRSRAFNGPAPRPAHSAPARDRWTEVAPDSHRDRRSALHEALPHIRKEISQ